jgi:hypothetical protein
MERAPEVAVLESEPKEEYEEPLLIMHEPLLDITGVKSGEKVVTKPGDEKLTDKNGNETM